MSYQAVLDTDEAIQVATTKGWGDVIRWIDGLDAESSPELAHLAQEGWTDKLKALADQIEGGLKDQPPSPSVASTLTDLITFLRANKDAESVMIS